MGMPTASAEGLAWIGEGSIGRASVRRGRRAPKIDNKKTKIGIKTMTKIGKKNNENWYEKWGKLEKQ